MKSLSSEVQTLSKNQIAWHRPPKGKTATFKARVSNKSSMTSSKMVPLKAVYRRIEAADAIVPTSKRVSTIG